MKTRLLKTMNVNYIVVTLLFFGLILFSFVSRADIATSSTAPIVINTHASSLTSDEDYQFSLPADDTACQGVGCDPTILTPYNLAASMSHILGEWGGPVSLGVKYDADLSWIANLGYVRMFNESFGLAAKVAAGANELRGNITGGVAFTDRQQLKITYEYLRQDAPFSFQSGEVNEWIGQNAAGAAYEYIIPNSFLYAIQLSGSWAEADNENLDTTVVYNDDVPYADLRRVAGGEEAGGLATVKLLPFSHTLLTVGAGYSQVNYDTDYDTDDDSDRSTLAYNADLSVLATCITKLSADINNTASSRELDAKINQILPWDTELAVWGQYSHGYGAMPDSKSVMLGLSYPAPKEYAFEGLDQVTQLYNSINTPVVYYQRVIAIADEALEKYTLSSDNLSNQTVNPGESITPVSTTDAFNFDSRLYDQVTYSLNVTKKTTSENVSVAANSQNYAQALNLKIEQKNNYTAQVSSGSGGTPSGTNGTYVVTITAKGQKSGLKEPIVATSSFQLTVTSAPVWQRTTLPPATVGQPYPCVNLTSGQYATISGFPSTAVIYALVSSQPWLQVSTQCLHPGNLSNRPKSTGSVNYYLVAGGSNQDEPVPATGADPNVILSATNKLDTSQTVNQSFVMTINQISPVWTAAPNLGTVSMTVLSQPLPVGAPIALDQYIQSGTGTGLSINIDPESSHGTNFVPSNWRIQRSNGHFYLMRVNNSGDVPGNTIVSIIATNSTSTTPVATPVNLVLETEPVPPVWTAAPDLGTVSMTILSQPLPVGAPIALDEYIQSGTGTGLSISIDPDSTHGTNFVPSNWIIQESNGHFYLVRVNNNDDVPGNTVVSIIATNSTSTSAVATPVNLVLEADPVPPVWTTAPDLGTVSMTALSQLLPVGAPIALDQYIQSGTGTGLSISIDPDSTHGTNFVPSNWTIQESNGHFYLVRVNNTGDVAGNTILSIIATNSTSTTSVATPLNLVLSP